ncbi:hypothetical protein JCM12214_11880 [Geobacillus vulcani]
MHKAYLFRLDPIRKQTEQRKGEEIAHEHGTENSHCHRWSEWDRQGDR